VVQEIEMVTSSLFLRRARVIVVLPAPDGEDITYIKPRRLISVIQPLLLGLSCVY
jgi:hypothetical protein